MSSVVRQSENFASSFAKQPLLGVTPPSNLPRAFWRQAVSFSDASPAGGFSFLLLQASRAVVFFVTHLFFPTAHAFVTGAG